LRLATVVRDAFVDLRLPTGGIDCMANKTHLPRRICVERGFATAFAVDARPGDVVWHGDERGGKHPYFVIHPHFDHASSHVCLARPIFGHRVGVWGSEVRAASIDLLRSMRIFALELFQLGRCV
jgi:hypothetical protein